MAPHDSVPSHLPLLLSKAQLLAEYLKTLDVAQITKIMKIKQDLAIKTAQTIASWDSKPSHQVTAIDAFLGDIYSGLQVGSFTEEDRAYADKTLVILSGLYGLIRPLDGIRPYRLEMAYRLAGFTTPSLYQFWGDEIAKKIPDQEIIINLSSVEYSKVVTDYVDAKRIVSPRFLSVNPKTKQPSFVVVHAKIARGALARWLIQNRIQDTKQLPEFKDLGYKYSKELSTHAEPVYVCEEFKGLGLSVRLTKAN
jgi:cytoplasmic iron level regulating protein YaaA (DUF328/UPF0246 family)